MCLSNDMLLQIIKYLLRWRWRFLIQPVFVLTILLLLAINFTQNDKEMMALLTLDEAGGADEGLYVGAGVAALGTGQGVLVLAPRATLGARGAPGRGP